MWRLGLHNHCWPPLNNKESGAKSLADWTFNIVRKKRALFSPSSTILTCSTIGLKVVNVRFLLQWHIWVRWGKAIISTESTFFGVVVELHWPTDEGGMVEAEKLAKFSCFHGRDDKCCRIVNFVIANQTWLTNSFKCPVPFWAQLFGGLEWQTYFLKVVLSDRWSQLYPRRWLIGIGSSSKSYREVFTCSSLIVDVERATIWIFATLLNTISRRKVISNLIRGVNEKVSCNQLKSNIVNIWLPSGKAGGKVAIFQLDKLTGNFDHIFFLDRWRNGCRAKLGVAACRSDIDRTSSCRFIFLACLCDCKGKRCEEGKDHHHHNHHLHRDGERCETNQDEGLMIFLCCNHLVTQDNKDSLRGKESKSSFSCMISHLLAMDSQVRSLSHLSFDLSGRERIGWIPPLSQRAERVYNRLRQLTVRGKRFVG